MQVGLSYIHEGEMFVAVTLVGTKGEMMSEGFSSDMARLYAQMMLTAADKLDEMNKEKQK